MSAEYRTPYLLLYNHSKGDDKNKKLLRKNEIRVAPKQQPSAKSTERKNYEEPVHPQLCRKHHHRYQDHSQKGKRPQLPRIQSSDEADEAEPQLHR